VKTLLAAALAAFAVNAQAATLVVITPIDYPTDAATFLANIADKSELSFTAMRNAVFRLKVPSMRECYAARDALLPNIQGVISCAR